MRFQSALFVSVAALGLATPALAQQAVADPSYACALFDECQPAAVEQPAEEEAAPAAPARGRISATRGMSMSGNRDRTSASVAQPGKPQGRVTGPSTVASQKGRTRVASIAPKKVMSRVEQQTVLAQGMTFMVGSAQLTPSAKAQALQLAAQMKRPDKLSTRFSIEGHTDASGSRDINLTLSRRRAEAIAAYLGTQGVDRSRLDILGYGFDKPLADLAPTNPRNRRVEVNPVKG